ncbi:MAG: hypothetical protein Q4G70_07055 [Pseudomonadota bacterium]|nr:hypothetical protein [Pseudomonadota bacterium]
MFKLLRYAWPLPWTVMGLLAALVARLLGARWRVCHGALEVHGGWLAGCCRRLPAPMRFEAITLGHVILGLDADCLDGARAHEHVHVRQYERWGPLFVPLYLASSAWQVLRGGRAYQDNLFEREAHAAAPLCHYPARRNDGTMME